MEPLTVNAATRVYPIYIKNNFDGLADAFLSANLKGRRVALVTDSIVTELYAKLVVDRLSEVSSQVSIITFKAGEGSKNFDTMQHIYKNLSENAADRKTVIAALGGGVTGDMAGFAAATYMRGVPFVQIPTSLLACVDAGVGGKTGIDFNGQKNLIGAFYQPEFVYMNTNVLKTLPRQEFISGMGEVIKHGLIRSVPYYEFISANAEGILSMDTECLNKLVRGSCEIKADVVSHDEKESGLREILNFGHTFGHALESLAEFQIPHGICVACGMKAAMYLSMKCGCIQESDLSSFLALASRYGFPLGSAARGFNARDIYGLMFSDKKTKDGKLNIILLDKIGHACINGAIPEKDIVDAIEYMCEG